MTIYTIYDERDLHGAFCTDSHINPTLSDCIFLAFTQEEEHIQNLANVSEYHIVSLPTSCHCVTGKPQIIL